MWTHGAVTISVKAGFDQGVFSLFGVSCRILLATFAQSATGMEE